MEKILGKNKTACSECIHFGNDRRLYGKQNTCKKFKEVCCAVNNGGDCSSFKYALLIQTRIERIAGKNKLTFSLSGQIFILDYEGTIEELKWYKEMLNKAFKNYEKGVLSK
jgi:hypothetical protein